MPELHFMAFYPSRRYWAGSQVNFDDQSYNDWFFNQMAEEVFSQTYDTYTLKICRDGQIMLRREDLEQIQDSLPIPPVAELTRIWGEYLNYLNAFYLLLDSSTIELSHLPCFDLQEITNKDAFRIRYENGRMTVASVSSESISVFPMERLTGYYPTGIPIQSDPRIAFRQVISLDVINHAIDLFARAVAIPGLVKILATFAKSLSEFKIGNYEISIVLAWFIIESSINQLWNKHIESLNHDLQDGRRRINSERRKLLIEGRDFTVNVVSNTLELWDILPNIVFQDIDKIRRVRNYIVHRETRRKPELEPNANNALLSMNTAQTMIKQLWGFNFTPNTTYSVSWL